MNMKPKKPTRVVKTENPTTDGYIGEMVEVSENQMAVRIAETDTGVKYHIVQENPWQLWKIVDMQGEQVINELFTSETLAGKALDKHLAAEAAKAKAEAEAKAKAEAEARAKAKAEAEKAKQEVNAQTNSN